MREEIKPNIKVVRELYPIVKKKILDFTDFWDNNPDKAENRHKEVEKELQELTGKDMSKYDLWEYWEADGIENLAFRISLPEPIRILDFKKEELKAVLTKIKTFEEPTEYENDEILMLEWANKDDFYRDLLKKNFNNYEHKYFNYNKDKNGNYFEYSIGEVVEILWNK